MLRRPFLQSLLATPMLGLHAAGPGLRLATFQADVTPPLESPLCHGNVTPARQILTPLLARGVVLLGAGEPIVLCALDWVALANASHEAIREALARAVATTPERVAVHTVHQHDAPGSDLDTERLLVAHGLGGRFSNAELDRRCFKQWPKPRAPAWRRRSRWTRSASGLAPWKRWPPTAAYLVPTARWPSPA